MTREDFKIYHSELMMYFQCVEFDLKRIYAGMSSRDFDESMDMLENSNFGNTLKMLKKLDYSDGKPWLSKEDYKIFNEIREMRNYWCHQCYLDYVYISNHYEREKEFQKIACDLYEDHQRMYELHKKIESIYITRFRKI